MASDSTKVVEDLNNAIYSLASLNPANSLATKLNNTWQVWFETNARGILPVSSWYPALKGFWAAYATARAGAQNLNERTPPAETINPALWKTLMGDFQERAELIKDAPDEAKRVAEQNLGDLLRGATKGVVEDVVKPVVFVGGALAVALLMFGMRRGRR